MNRFNLTNIKILSALCLSLFANSSYAKVSASVNQNQIYENEPVRLIIESDESGTPDLSALSSFDILQSGQSQEFSCVNGQCNTKQAWSYVLQPTQKATSVTIPAIKVGNSQTLPIKIEIKAGNNPNIQQNSPSRSQNQYQSQTQELKTSDIIAKYKFNDKTIMVNQTEVFYLNVLIPEQLVSFISKVDLDFPKTDQIQFEKINSQFHENWTVHDGKRYLDLDVPVALTAVQSGAIKLEPINFILNGVYNFRPFEDSIPSDSTELTVEQKPKDYPANEPFYPAQNLEVQSSWSTDKPQIKEGESVIQKITIKAQGLSTSQLSAPASPEIEGVKIYIGDKKQRPTWIENGAINGQIEVERTFVATKTGEIIFHEQLIPWWNTKTHQIEYAKIEEKKFTVINNPDLVTEPENNLSSNDSAQSSSLSIWLWLIAVLIIIILGLIYYFIMFKKQAIKSESSVAPVNPLKKASQIKPLLKQACLNNEPQKTKEYLDQLIKLKLLMIDKVLLNPDFKTAYETLNQAVYGNQSTAWDGSAFWNAFIKATQKQAKNTSKKDDELPPIYPI